MTMRIPKIPLLFIIVCIVILLFFFSSYHYFRYVLMFEKFNMLLLFSLSGKQTLEVNHIRSCFIILTREQDIRVLPHGKRDVDYFHL